MSHVLRLHRGSLVLTCLLTLTACGSGGGGADEPDGARPDAAAHDGGADDAGAHDGGTDELDASDAEDAATGPCAPNPCANGGACAPDPEEEGAVVCTCAAGWTGETCATSIDDCGSSRPCKNGGTCVDGHQSFTCDCAPGFDGPRCETDIADCPATNPCANGGGCIDRVDGYVCSCPAGFGGPTCAATCDGTVRTASVSGAWNAPGTWGGVVPSPTDTVVIADYVTVTVPAGVTVRVDACAKITVHGTLRNEGDFTADGLVSVESPNVMTAAALVNAGTFVLNGSMTSSIGVIAHSDFRNEAGGTFRVRGPITYSRFRNDGELSVEAGVTQTGVGSFSNTGTITIFAGALLFATVPIVDVAVNTGTIVNRGTFQADHLFHNRGTLENEGVFKGIADGTYRCGMENQSLATLTNYAEWLVSCPMTNAGTITNFATVNVTNSREGIVMSTGTIHNERTGSYLSYGYTQNDGVFVNRGNLEVQTTNFEGFRHTGTLTSSGPIKIVDRLVGSATATIVIEAGSTISNYGLFQNSGEMDLYGKLAILSRVATTSNFGTLRQHCGSVIMPYPGQWGVTGNAPEVIPCP